MSLAKTTCPPILPVVRELRGYQFSLQCTNKQAHVFHCVNIAIALLRFDNEHHITGRRCCVAADVDERALRYE